MSRGPTRRRSIGKVRLIAAAIRDGKTIDECARNRHVPVEMVIAKLRDAGFSPVTGEKFTTPPKRETGPLTESAGGYGGPYVGGTDRVPSMTPVRYRSRPKPTGLDWDALTPAEEPPVVKPPTQLDERRQRGKPGPRAVLQGEIRETVIRRYLAGESAMRLGAEYGVADPTILKTVRDAGHKTRTRLDAIELHKQQRRQQQEGRAS